MTFEELGVSKPLLQAIEALGFVTPMPVQEAVIPYLLGERNDVIALAQTGTGKTAAYGLPVIQRIDITDNTTQAIVICPTRELCLQIAGDLKDFSAWINGLHILPVYGGASIETQIHALKKGVHIIVATPGRLIDLMERGAAKLDKVRTVVLDEADEMLNMGFSESIDAILAGVPDDRNTLLFSATMSKEIEKIAQNYLHNPKEIVVGSRNEGAELVNHEYYLVQAKDKYLALKRIVDYYPKIYAIVFCRTRIETQEVADKLIQDGYNAEALHGELSQAARDLAMQKFRQHHTQLLVATDVAARGLDVDDLTHVINYGLPDDVENYTHRSGRTGRAGKKGTSICIIHLREKGKVRTIEKTIGKEFVKKSLPTPQEICTKQLYRAIDRLESVQLDEEQIAPFLPDAMRKLEWLDKEDIIKRFVGLTFGRFLSYYANEPEIKEPQTSSEHTRDGKKKKNSSQKGEPIQAEEGFVRFYFGAGKKDHFYAREIIGTLNRYIAEKVEVGRVDLKNTFSFFEVPEEDADMVEAALHDIHDRNGRHIPVERASEEGSAPRKRGGNEKRKSDNKRGGNEGKRERNSSDRKHSSRKDTEYASSRRERGNSRKERSTGSKSGGAKNKETSGKNKFRKDDWIDLMKGSKGKFELKGEVPDFSEDGWVKKSRKKKKK